MFLLNYVAGFG